MKCKNQVFLPDLTEFSRISCRPSTIRKDVTKKNIPMTRQVLCFSGM